MAPFSINYRKVPFEDANGRTLEEIHHLARTLEPIYLGSHENGWEIEGEVQSDYFEWVNGFSAKNTKTGEFVYGDFEETVYASSEKTLHEFLKIFPYQEWDYWDI